MRVIDLKDCTDIMVDIETTGLRPDRAAIIQIAAVPFNLPQFAYGDHYLDIAIHIPQNRSWDLSTKNWWASKESVFREIESRMREPEYALRSLQQIVSKMKTPVRFWCKRIFDFQFIESYFKDFNMTSPFTYWEAREMISYLDGICFPHHRPKVNPTIFGELHNAYVDACKQIEEMFLTIKEMKGCEGDFAIGSKGKY